MMKDVLTTKKKTTALSLVWMVFSFITSVFIMSDSHDSGFLGFFAFFLLFNAPIWLYWIGFWVWGDGYILKVFKIIIVTPATEIMSLITKLIFNLPKMFSITFLKKLIKGGVPLVITYWVFGWFGNIIFAAIDIAIIEPRYFDISKSKTGEWVLRTFYLLWFLYGIFILAAIWNSAGQYKKINKDKRWGEVARFIAVMGVIKISLNLISGFNNSESQFENEILTINKSLPSMVDEYTRLDRVLIQGRDIYYTYTLVKLTAENVDTQKLKSLVEPSLKTNACSDKQIKDLLNDDRKMVYSYYDNLSKPIAKIEISKQDCL